MLTDTQWNQAWVAIDLSPEGLAGFALERQSALLKMPPIPRGWAFSLACTAIRVAHEAWQDSICAAMTPAPSASVGQGKGKIDTAFIARFSPPAEFLTPAPSASVPVTILPDPDQPGFFLWRDPMGNGSDISFPTKEEAEADAVSRLT
jgi:hypothetical protein